MAIVVAKPVNKKGQTSKSKRVYLEIDKKVVSFKFVEKLVHSNLGEDKVKAVFETDDPKVIAAFEAKGYSVIEAKVAAITKEPKAPTGASGSSETPTREELLAKYAKLKGKPAPSNMLEATLVTKIAELEAAKVE